MGFKTCMNILCGTTSSADWKTGWRLRSGELANLCLKCGSAFEQHVYCEEFHADDSGWRKCATCAKRLHCGCIASWSLMELLDGGGVKCIVCAKKPGPISSMSNGKRNVSASYHLTENKIGAKHFGKYEGNNGTHLSILWNPEIKATRGFLKQEDSFLPFREVASTSLSSLPQSPMGLFQKARFDMSSLHIQAKDNNHETVAHPNLNITLGVPTGNLHHPVSNALPQGLMSHQFSPRSNLALSPASDTNMTTVSSTRVARPPIDGRGRHQLLPRYWPRITDQELQQISGDPNCTIVPLFEKILSASDAGRIGRLVLPKACAETYFPPISQAEGLPIKIQDIKGTEWVFQFRFWPNNNSRMYVLEGVTPCIQSMQLQAGDTVTFSRLDPEGKLVMGYRKSLNSTTMKSIKSSTEPHSNASLSRQLESSGGNVKWVGGEKYGESTEEGMLPASTPMMEKKKGRNIGSKNKRLLIDSQDALALKLTWEEVQGMLRPPQSARPSIFVVEDCEIEEYEEPPVFGKSTIFTAHPSGIIEQWAQCDTCLKWRRLPADVLLPPKWTCFENVWDPTRCCCSAPNELSPRELQNFQVSKDTKKRRMPIPNKILQDQESCGLDALVTAATLGDNNPSSSSVGETTKHPRHRPGCSCIVCIQPPSGKGKHKSTCTCTVCMTVKRRFKTLMLRKKKRQSDQEAAHQLPLLDENPENITGGTQDGPNPDDMLVENGKGLDLNSHPEREEELLRAHVPSEVGRLTGLHSPTPPLESEIGRIVSGLNRELDEKLVEDHAGGQSVEEQANIGVGRNSESDPR